MAWGYGSQRQPWQLSEEWPTVQPGTEFYAYVEDPLAWQRTGWYQYTVAGWDKAKRLYEAWEASGLHTGLFNEKTVLAGVKRLEKGAIKGEERVVARWGRGELYAAPVDLRRWPCKAEPRRRGEVFPPCVSGYKPYGTLEMAGPMLFHLHSRLRRSRDFRKILDVGAGTGRMAKWLTLWGFEVTALDVMQPEHPEFDNIQTFDGREFPLNDKSVDCSIFSFVLHHCRHFELQQALLKEAARVTKHWIAICEDTPEETLHWKATRGHDGKGTFNSASEWLRLFHKLGLQVLRRGPIWTGPRHGPSPYFCARAFFILEVPSDLCPQPVCRGTCANAAPALPPRGAGAAEACAALQAQAKTHAQREGPDPESVAILRDIKAEWMDTDADFTAFSQLRLPQLFEQSLARQGFGAPSPIQRRAVPLALQGRDLVGVAATGSGKTLAFLLPMLLRSLSCQLPAGPFGLVLLPTRELALQVKSCVDALTEEPEEQSAVEMARHLSAVCVWGGGERQKQKRQLRDTGGVWILAATPGRLLDLCIEEEDEGRRPLETVRVLVLDEGDRMLEEGMEEQLDAVARRTALWRQTLFFSATWREEKVGPVALRFCSDPVIVRIEQGDGGEGACEAGIRHIKQTVEVFDDENEEEREVQKLARLLDLLRLTLEEEAGKAMVFCMTKKLADTLVEKLAVGGYEAVAVHGNKTQQERIANLERFAGPSAKAARVLVTTDVLGRGIDIPKVTHVFIYDMPGCIDDYIHRIGRTARGMETEGHAISFFEYANCVPQMAQELLEHLEATGQDAPPELRRIAQEVAEGGRTWKKAKESALSWDLASCEELGAWHAAGFRSWMLEYNTAKGKVSGWLVFGAKGVLHTDTKDGTWRLEEEKMHVEFGGFKLCLQLFPTWQGKKRPNFISAAAPGMAPLTGWVTLSKSYKVKNPA